MGNQSLRDEIKGYMNGLKKKEPKMAGEYANWYRAGGDGDVVPDYLEIDEHTPQNGFLKYPGLVQKTTFEPEKINLQSFWHPGY